MTVTARCAWCGLIEAVDDWRQERRKRSVSYTYTTCSRCAVLEDQLVEGKTKKAKAPSLRGMRQPTAHWDAKG